MSNLATVYYVMHFFTPLNFAFSNYLIEYVTFMS